MRVFTATLATETNTFAPMPTGLASYREVGLRSRALARGGFQFPHGELRFELDRPAATA
jgi:hypothetical protein